MPIARADRSRLTTPASRWHTFHFSGKVILCSVIFGFCFVLVGGLVFAIPMEKDTTSNVDDAEDIITKPPATYVGPVMMGIGGFAVVSGVIMCCLETQLCRKRNSEANPLVPEVAADSKTLNSDSTSAPKSKHHHYKKQCSHKRGVSPKSPRTKEAAKKESAEHSAQAIDINGDPQSSSVEAGFVPKKVSPKENQTSSPVAIEVSGKFQSLSEETFLTPPDVGVEYNQIHIPETKKSESTDPKWDQSCEFKTPSASFSDRIETPALKENIDKMTEVDIEKSTEVNVGKSIQANVEKLPEVSVEKLVEENHKISTDLNVEKFSDESVEMLQNSHPSQISERNESAPSVLLEEETEMQT